MFRVAAVLIAAAAVFAVSRLDVTGATNSAASIPVPELRNAVNVLAGVSATLLGFLVAAGALLYAVANTRLVRNLQRTGHFQNLVSDLFVDAGAFLLALIASLVCLFVPTIPVGQGSMTLLEVGIGTVVFTNVLAYILLLPVGRKMWLLLTNLEPEDMGRLE